MLKVSLSHFIQEPFLLQEKNGTAFAIEKERIK
jgi:hypothetical protein